MPGAGASAFPTDPQTNPRESPALWSPDSAPDVVVIESADPTIAIPLPCHVEPLVEAATAAERHLVMAHGPTRLRLCLRFAPDRPAPAISIPYDDTCALRLAAAARWQRVTSGSRPEPLPVVTPTLYQRSRFAQLLSIHDALEDGASPHDLAFGLVFQGHRPLAGAMWKGSGERRHVLRLIASARLLVSSGYRTLLLHR